MADPATWAAIGTTLAYGAAGAGAGAGISAAAGGDPAQGALLGGTLGLGVGGAGGIGGAAFSAGSAPASAGVAPAGIGAATAGNTVAQTMTPAMSSILGAGSMPASALTGGMPSAAVGASAIPGGSSLTSAGSPIAASVARATAPQALWSGRDFARAALMANSAINAGNMPPGGPGPQMAPMPQPMYDGGPPSLGFMDIAGRYRYGGPRMMMGGYRGAYGQR